MVFGVLLFLGLATTLHLIQGMCCTGEVCSLFVVFDLHDTGCSLLWGQRVGILVGALMKDEKVSWLDWLKTVRSQQFCTKLLLKLICDRNSNCQTLPLTGLHHRTMTARRKTGNSCFVFLVSRFTCMGWTAVFVFGAHANILEQELRTEPLEDSDEAVADNRFVKLLELFDIAKGGQVP